MKKQIKDFPGYSVDDLGNVWSRRANKGKNEIILKPTNGSRLKVSLCKNGKAYNKKIHILVMQAFVGLPPVGMVVRHLNGDPSDNSLQNLCYGTPKENGEDMVKHGHSLRGEKSPISKYKTKDVLKMRELKEGGMAVKEIAKIFGALRTTVEAITSRRTWKHI